MHRLHKSIVLVIVVFGLSFLSPLLCFVLGFCSTAHCRGQVTDVAQAVLTEEQSVTPVLSSKDESHLAPQPRLQGIKPK